jgi:WD40 repeat protein
VISAADRLPPLTWDDPFPGLNAFREQDADYFHGRGREAEDLLRLLEQRTLTVLYGVSGLGKTSLLQAGLFPRMRRAGLAPILVRPGFREEAAPLDKIFTAIRRSIDEGALRAAPPESGDSLRDYFGRAGFWDEDGEPVTPVLVLDQFEELFTFGEAHRGEVQALLGQLAGLVHGRGPQLDRPPAKVLIALREDYLAQLKDLRDVLPALAVDGYRLRPLGGLAAFEAVLAPGRRVLGAKVAKRIVCAAAGAPLARKLARIEEVDPAILALHCQELCRARVPGKAIDTKLFKARKEQILDGFYARQTQGMSDELCRFIEMELLDASGHRDTRPLSRVAELGIGDAVEALREARLLHYEPRLKQTYVELAHDVLTRPVGKRRAARAEKEEREQWRRKRNRWLRGAGIAALLLGSAAGAEAYTASSQRRAAEDKQLRARVEGDEARAQQLAGLAWRATTERRWEDAVRILVPAYEALGSARALRASPALLRPPPPPDDALLGMLGARLSAAVGAAEVAFSEPQGIRSFRTTPGGRLGLILGGDGRTVTFLDFETRGAQRAAPPGRLPTALEKAKLLAAPFEIIDWFLGPVRSLVPSGDGSLVFGVGEEGRVVAWRTADRERVLGFRTQLTGARVRLLPDRTGRRVLLWDDDRDRALVLTLDLAAPRRSRGVEIPSRAPQQAEDAPSGWTGMWLSPDGARVITTTDRLGERGGESTATLGLYDAGSDLRAPREKEEKHGVSSLAFSEDGGLLAFVSVDGKVRRAGLAGGGIEDPEPLQGVSSARWIAFPGPGRALLVGTHRTLELWDLSGEPRQVWEVPAGGSSAQVQLSPDRTGVLARFGDEVRYYEVASGRLRAFLPCEPARGQIFLRFRGSEPQLVSSTSDVVRVQTPAVPAPDRVLRSDGGGAQALTAVPLPLTDAFRDVAVDGAALTMLTGSGATVITGLDGPTPEAHPWHKPDAAVLRALRRRGGHVTAVDAAGVAYFGDDQGARNQAWVRGLAKAGASGRTLLDVDTSGTWAVISNGGPFASCWNTERPKAVWAGDIRRKGDLTQISVTAVTMAAKGPELGSVPTAYVGDDAGNVRALSPNRKGDWTPALLDHRHGAAVSALAVGPKKLLASGAEDGTLALWTDGKPGPSAQLGGPVRALAFAEGGALLVTRGADRVLRVLATADGSQRCPMPEHTDNLASVDVEQGPKGRVLSVDDDGNALLWRAADCQVQHRWRGVRYAAFVASEADRFVTISVSGRVEVWDQSSAATQSWAFGGFSGPTTLIAGDETGTAAILSPNGGTATRGAAPDAQRGSPLVAAAEGRLAAIGPGGALTTWEGAAPGVKGQLGAMGTFTVRAAGISLERHALITVEESPTGALRRRTFDWAAWSAPRAEAALAAGPACGAAPAPESAAGLFAVDCGRALSIDGTGCVRLWSTDGTLALETPDLGASDTERRPTAAALEPCGTRLVVGQEDGGVSFWEQSRTGGRLGLRRVGLEVRHQARVRALAFHPGRRFAASGGDDGQVWLWDASEGHAVVRLGAHPAPIRWATFRPDGGEVVTGGAEGWLRAFSTSPALGDPQATLAALRKWLPEQSAPTP